LVPISVASCWRSRLGSGEKGPLRATTTRESPLARAGHSIASFEAAALALCDYKAAQKSLCDALPKDADLHFAGRTVQFDAEAELGAASPPPRRRIVQARKLGNWRLVRPAWDTANPGQAFVRLCLLEARGRWARRYLSGVGTSAQSRPPSTHAASRCCRK